jgi:hypothetical protein
MPGKKRRGLSVLGGLVVVVAASGGLAQEENQDQYQGSVKPGLHISVDASNGSALSQAAREGRALVISDSEEQPAEMAPGMRMHVVAEGDTLWDICTRLLGDPYLWPRVWSFNPEVTNPHWIYPGDVIWIVPRDQVQAMAAPTATPLSQPARAPGAVLLRNRGFVDKKILDQSGEVVGAHKEIAMLSQFDEAYVEFQEDAPVSPGEQYAAFVVLGPVGGHEDPGTEVGKLVEILGQVTVTRYDPETHIARAVVNESVKPIERGTLIGPVHRKFDLVPVVTNQQDLVGHVIEFLEPLIMAATHHVVFVDLGREDGVVEGNRLFAVEKRDNLRESQDKPDDRETYPIEVIAEIRVIEARPQTSTCLVTASIREFEIGQRVEMRQGY